ncbi:Probable diguanylate cyclase AdrA [Delftia tsuruhatensis]|uniref:GGDEF domain-containing protein n=1 Tax=Delftia tsuruhatensis TaxID=180282 RepID=UPI001E78599B|nr:GGDEF domain-containing protein [Delftia tsuruhatensis]CAB5661272.1 Probable diguanylate cyclase AdrA [Delftia tsuruhatensis]CAC9680060.1 Probable diguanylate cyclase AdrA [Delftia tsuruhatensis]
MKIPTRAALACMDSRWSAVLGAMAVVFCVVFAASIFGILTRPLGFLAAFWPANAVLLGLFLRFPALATRYGWMAATAGYLAADFSTGGDLALTLWLTASNLSGVATGCLLFGRHAGDHRDLRQPRAMFFLFVVCVAAAAASMVVGAGIAPVFYGRELVAGMAYWFTTELANSIIVLPVMLSLPAVTPGAGAARHSRSLRSGAWRRGLVHALPILSLVVSVFAAVVIGGPGALAFPVPALVWCALSYDVFGTALITMTVCVWKMTAVAEGWVALPNLDHFMSATVSLRLGITLLAMAPLVVVSLNSSRDEAMRRLDAAANHDSLTGALSRLAFTQRAQQMLERQRAAQASLSMLMMDLDHFKRINDVHGHLVGDRVLHEVGRSVLVALREADLFGRLGGEEFAVLLPGLSQPQAMAVAERLRAAIDAIALPLEDGANLRVTASLGLAQSGPAGWDASLEQFLQVADATLYAAKSGGRNGVVAACVL